MRSTYSPDSCPVTMNWVSAVVSSFRTLALIVNRESEIKNFAPAPYWELYAVFKKEDGQT